MIAALVIGAWLCGGLGCFYSYRLGIRRGRWQAHEQMSADREAQVPYLPGMGPQ